MENKNNKQIFYHTTSEGNAQEIIKNGFRKTRNEIGYGTFFFASEGEPCNKLGGASFRGLPIRLTAEVKGKLKILPLKSVKRNDLMISELKEKGMFKSFYVLGKEFFGAGNLTEEGEKAYLRLLKKEGFVGQMTDDESQEVVIWNPRNITSIKLDNRNI